MRYRPRFEIYGLPEETLAIQRRGLREARADRAVEDIFELFNEGHTFVVTTTHVHCPSCGFHKDTIANCDHSGSHLQPTMVLSPDVIFNVTECGASVRPLRDLFATRAPDLSAYSDTKMISSNGLDITDKWHDFPIRLDKRFTHVIYLVSTIERALTRFIGHLCTLKMSSVRASLHNVGTVMKGPGSTHPRPKVRWS